MSKQKNCRFIASTIGIVKSVVNNLNRRLHAVIEVLMSTALRGDNTLHPKSVGHLVELMEAKRGKRNTLNHGGCRGDYTTDTISADSFINPLLQNVIKIEVNALSMRTGVK